MGRRNTVEQDRVEEVEEVEEENAEDNLGYMTTMYDWISGRTLFTGLTGGKIHLIEATAEIQTLCIYFNGRYYWQPRDFQLLCESAHY